MSRRGEGFAVGHPGGVGREVGIAGEIESEDLAQGPELAVVAHGQDQDAILGRQCLVGGDAGVGIAHRPRHGPGADHRLRLVHQRRQRRAQQVHRDLLADVRCGARSCSAARIPTVACSPVSTSTRATPTLVGWSGVGAGDAHQPAHRLDEQVVAGHGRTGPGAEARDGRVDHTGVHRCDVGVAEAEAPHRPGREVLDEHVGGRGQLECLGAVRRVTQVQPHRALVAVDRLEVRGRAIGGARRTPRAGVVAVCRALDLDDLRTEVTEHHRGVGPGEHAAEVGDADPRQRTRGCLAHR